MWRWKRTKKDRFLLLTGIGISNLGDWIYLIALNLMILNMTGSAAAVAGLYILKPLASMVTSFWSGSIIDRYNKRRIMMALDISRAFLVAIIPFFSTILFIYVVVLMINMASAFFHPTSTTYITKFIPIEDRKRFNSLQNLMSSGAFLIGPAVAGFLFLFGSSDFAIYMNALSFLLSAVILFLLPNLDTKGPGLGAKLSINLLKTDWQDVIIFSKKAIYVMTIYTLFQFAWLMTAALDSTEVVFTREILNLSETSYGLLVSIAGIGFVIGSFIVTIVAQWINIRHLIGLGTTMTAVGYLIYAFSTTFTGGAMGFFILSLSLAVANTGFITFYQNNLPIDLMGRVMSVAEVFQAILQMIVILLLGIAGEVVSIKYVVIVGSSIMLLVAIGLLIMTMLTSKSTYFYETKSSVNSEAH